MPKKSKPIEPADYHLKKQSTVRLSEAGWERAERLGKKHGGKSGAIEAALKLLDGHNGGEAEAVLAKIREVLDGA